MFRSVAVIAAASALTLSACGSDDAGTDDDTLTIVASTNVYGDIASAVAGDDVEVISILTSSNQDPHEYEATAQDRLKLDGADIVVSNGGGYDPFVDTLLDGSDAEPVLIEAVEVSGLLPGDEHSHDHEGEGEGGHDHEGEEGHDDEGEEGHDHEGEEGHEGHDHIEGFNEHVWYDFHSMDHLAEEISAELSELDPDNASTYEANYAAFAEQIETLEASVEDLEETAEGQGVAITEPIAVYLLEAVGLENLTPDEFSESVEEGADVPPRALAATLDLFDGDEVSVLAYNSQTDDATTEQVRAAAEAADVPVVDFSETLPEGMTYIEWQQANLDALAGSLGS